MTKLPKTLHKDLVAGFTGAVIGIPQAMGFALIAGINPIYSLYTALVSTLVASFLMRSSLLTVGPTNALALVVFSTLAPVDTGAHPTALFTLTLLVGVIQLVFGLLHFQRYVRFVSHPVMTGFITGAALLIMLGQVSHITGYETSLSSDNSLVRFWDWLIHWQQWHAPTTVLGVIALGLIWGLRNTRLKYFRVLVAISAVSIVVPLLNLQDIPIVTDIAAIPSGLPGFIRPDLALVPQFLVAAVSIALLALIQSVGITEALPEISATDLDDNRDFLGQGIANIIGGFFQGMPSGGSLSRTAVNVDVGAQTRLSNTFAALFVALILLTMNRVVEQIVLAALAAHLFLAGMSLIRISDIAHVWRVSKSGRIAMLVTFISTLVLPLEYSIMVGVFFHLLQYTITSSHHVHITQLVYDEHAHAFQELSVTDALKSPITVLSIQGNLFFAGIPQLRSELPKPSDNPKFVVIFRMRNVSYLGTTGIKMLADYAADLQAHNGTLILAGVNDHIVRQIELNHDIDSIRKLKIFPAEATLLGATQRAYEYASKLIVQVS